MCDSLSHPTCKCYSPSKGVRNKVTKLFTEKSQTKLGSWNEVSSISRHSVVEVRVPCMFHRRLWLFGICLKKYDVSIIQGCSMSFIPLTTVIYSETNLIRFPEEVHLCLVYSCPYQLSGETHSCCFCMDSYSEPLFVVHYGKERDVSPVNVETVW